MKVPEERKPQSYFFALPKAGIVGVQEMRPLGTDDPARYKRRNRRGGRIAQ